ncbi:MAG: UPF0175 family protein [Ardenticatenaceae bacterium]|nr:UPF0175 family protein [Ardenticatenaceae bacterium]
MFQAHKLTLGQAVELADLSREQFLFELDRRQIPLIDYDPAELERINPLRLMKIVADASPLIALYPFSKKLELLMVLVCRHPGASGRVY